MSGSAGSSAGGDMRGGGLLLPGSVGTMPAVSYRPWQGVCRADDARLPPRALSRMGELRGSEMLAGEGKAKGEGGRCCLREASWCGGA